MSPQPLSDDDSPAARRGEATAWKVATAVTAALGLTLAGTVYLLKDQEVDRLQDDLAAARADRDEGNGALDDLLGDLDLGDLEGLLGGDLGDLLGGGLGDVDPILFECLTPDGLGGALGGEGSIPEADIETQVKAVRDIVEDERGLTVDGELSIEFVSPDEVRRRAVELSDEELDRELAALQARLLAALGAVEPGTDLAQAQLDALDAGVGGFYNPDTGELVIGSEQLDGMGAYITAHEMVHALADAAVGLPDQEALAENEGADAAYAALNAIEGDATLYGQMFTSNHLPLDQLMGLEAQSAEAEAAMSTLPHVVRRNLEFPYLEGMTFTCDVFLDGGWSAVDETYTDPPATTAQVLFPDRYRAGEAAVDVRDLSGIDGWDEVLTDTFGAADLLFLLEAPGGDTGAALEKPKELVKAWAGGEYTVWDREGDTAVALVLAQHDEGPPLCETMADYYAAAFPESTRSDDGGSVVFTGDAQAAVLTCDDDAAEVAFGIAPDVATARAAVTS